MTKKIIGIIAVIIFIVTSSVLIAAIHVTFKYPDRMWMHEERGPFIAEKGVISIDDRVKLGFLYGTNQVWGTLGVVREGNEYVVIWQPID